MLPGDTKQRREAATDTGHKTQQTMLTNHFTTEEQVTPCSESALEAAAIKWLVQNNQVHLFISPHYITDLLCLADPGIQQTWLQGDVGYRISSNAWHHLTLTQENSCTHCAYVQATNVSAQETS